VVQLNVIITNKLRERL